jgi:hypothetical protein
MLGARPESGSEIQFSALNRQRHLLFATFAPMVTTESSSTLLLILPSTNIPPPPSLMRWTHLQLTFLLPIFNLGHLVQTNQKCFSKDVMNIHITRKHCIAKRAGTQKERLPDPSRQHAQSSFQSFHLISPFMLAAVEGASILSCIGRWPVHS